MKDYINSKIEDKSNLDEEMLFSNLADYLNKGIAKALFAGNVHKHNGFIDYPSNILGRSKKIEIADLQIINHDVTKNVTKISFMQAKYKREKPRRFLCFKGNAFQLELLTIRPVIIDSYGLGFPSNILSFTKYKTISSFGIFYRDSDGRIDLLYSVPENIEASRAVEHTSMRYKKNTDSVTVAIQSMADETITAESMVEFQNALLLNRIGAPVDIEIKGYIAKVLGSIYMSTSNTFIKEFSKESGIKLNYDDERFKYISTLLIISKSKDELLTRMLKMAE